MRHFFKHSRICWRIHSSCSFKRIIFRIKRLPIGGLFYFYSVQVEFLHTPIEFLKGVGPAKAELLKSELGIADFGGLLYHLPFRYIDRTEFHKVSAIQSDLGYIQLKGKITKLQEVGADRKKRLVATFQDDTGTVDLVWFKGAAWIKSMLNYGETYIIFGKPNSFKGVWNIPHPDIEKEDSHRLQSGATLMPVYSSTEKLNSKGVHTKGIAKLTATLIQKIEGQVAETLSDSILKKHNFMSKEDALRIVHAPQDLKSLEKAITRLKFEELFFLQLLLVRRKMKNTIQLKSVSFLEVGNYFNTFYKECLPFDLTGAQKRVLKEIRSDVRTGKHMNRLVQGDVGSGKTIVALLAALLAIDNGFQACIMAPTEILANQHFESISEVLGELDIKVRLLTGSVKTAARRIIHEELESGELNILIGTHALIEPKVRFKNLGLAIIDEQHRFGVAQRASLWKKAALPPHVLVMTATPIPRTLAMTLYGDLDISIIDELPPGRKPIKTVHRTDAGREEVFGFMEKQIALGRQVYVVYPLIEGSEKLDYKDLIDGYESMCRRFPRPAYQVSIVHGKMKAQDKEFEMQRFVNQETQILIATTVIEVGVNVPNASVMVIESAERFGLSQLHQLRGRVGRGSDKSYCILMSSNKLGEDARKRIETMIRTNDGFEIAEVDLGLRGPGDIMGTQQSGMPDLIIADFLKDKEIMVTARHSAEIILDEDPLLEHPEHASIARELDSLLKSRPNWSRIS